MAFQREWKLVETLIRLPSLNHSLLSGPACLLFSSPLVLSHPQIVSPEHSPFSLSSFLLDIVTPHVLFFSAERPSLLQPKVYMSCPSEESLICGFSFSRTFSHSRVTNAPHSMGFSPRRRVVIIRRWRPSSIHFFPEPGSSLVFSRFSRYDSSQRLKTRRKM